VIPSRFVVIDEEFHFASHHIEESPLIEIGVMNTLLVDANR
jgi:hypothetical protein